MQQKRDPKQPLKNRDIPLRSGFGAAVNSSQALRQDSRIEDRRDEEQQMGHDEDGQEVGRVRDIRDNGGAEQRDHEWQNLEGRMRRPQRL